MPLGFSRTVLVALAALSACKGKADESFVLDNETEVVLTESGGLALLRDGPLIETRPPRTSSLWTKRSSMAGRSPSA